MQWSNCTNTSINIGGRHSRNMVTINSKQYSNGYLYIYSIRKYLRNNSTTDCNSNTTGNTDI